MNACAVVELQTKMGSEKMRNLKILTAVFVTGAMSLPAFADDTAFDVEKLSCFDVISLAEDDSLFVTAMLIGYMNGKSGSAETSPVAIQTKVEAFDKTCGDNPDMAAMDALK